MQPFSIEQSCPVTSQAKMLENLAASCQGCNNHKYQKTHVIDPATGLQVAIFILAGTLGKNISPGTRTRYSSD